MEPEEEFTGVEEDENKESQLAELEEEENNKSRERRGNRAARGRGVQTEDNAGRSSEERETGDVSNECEDEVREEAVTEDKEREKAAKGTGGDEATEGREAEIEVVNLSEGEGRAERGREGERRGASIAAGYGDGEIEQRGGAGGRGANKTEGWLTTEGDKGVESGCCSEVTSCFSCISDSRRSRDAERNPDSSS